MWNWAVAEPGDTPNSCWGKQQDKYLIQEGLFFSPPKGNRISQRRQRLLSQMWEWRGKQQAALSFSGNPKEKTWSCCRGHWELDFRKYTICWNFSLFPSEMFMIQTDQWPSPFCRLLHYTGKWKQNPGPNSGIAVKNVQRSEEEKFPFDQLKIKAQTRITNRLCEFI